MADQEVEEVTGEEEQEETMEGQEEEAAEVVEGEGEEAAEVEEVKEEDKPKAVKVPYFLPAVPDFTIDMAVHSLERAIVIYPVSYKDLNKRPVSAILMTTKSMQLGFQRSPHGVENIGYLHLVFNTPEEAADSIVKFAKIYKEGVTIKLCAEEPAEDLPHKTKRDPQFKLRNVTEAKTHAVELHYRPENAITIPDLDENITEEELCELFPDADLVYIPVTEEERTAIKEREEKEEKEAKEKAEKEEKAKAAEAKEGEDEEVKKDDEEKKEDDEEKKEDDEEKKEKEEEKKEDEEEKKDSKENGDKKDQRRRFDRRRRNPKFPRRYAYICFADAESSAAVVDQDVTLREKEYHTHAITEMPSVEEVLQTITDERLHTYPGNFNQMPDLKKKRLQTLQRQATHFIRMDSTSPRSRQDLMEQRAVLDEFIKGSRRGQSGAPGKQVGGRGGPPMKRSRNDAFGYAPPPRREPYGGGYERSYERGYDRGYDRPYEPRGYGGGRDYGFAYEPRGYGGGWGGNRDRRW